MTVYTGDVKSAGTDSQISVTFFGTGGSSSETKLSKEEDRYRD